VSFFTRTLRTHAHIKHQWLAAAGIIPSTEKTYTRAEIEAALQAPRGVKAIIQCDYRNPGEFREIWYHFLVRGSLQDGDFVASDPDFSGVGGSKDTCPETGIRYLPKRSRDEGPSPTTTGSSPPGETGEPSGKGKLVIRLDNGGDRGCLISNGKWYNTRLGSSCATFRAHEQKDGAFTLRSSRGPCGIGGDQLFFCGRGAPDTVFKSEEGKLVTKDVGTSTGSWSAKSIPHGTEQREIYYADSGDVRLDLVWRS
jgi:ribonuclease T2